MKKFENKAVFRKCLDDLQFLSQQGINFKIDETVKTVYFECVLFLGDNLGMNTVCGFSEGSHAKYFCRICNATSAECENMTVEDPTLLRSVESYDILVANIESENMGIKESCIFNELTNFHICENISVDVMHDVFEEIVPCVIENVLQVIVEKFKLTLEIINNKIATFPYNDIDRNNKPRPSFFTPRKGGSKLKMKQSAAEMLHLTRYLGLMI